MGRPIDFQDAPSEKGKAMHTVVRIKGHPDPFVVGYVMHVSPEAGGLEVFFPTGLRPGGQPAAYLLPPLEVEVADFVLQLEPDMEAQYRLLPRPTQLRSREELLAQLEAELPAEDQAQPVESQAPSSPSLETEVQPAQEWTGATLAAFLMTNVHLPVEATPTEVVEAVAYFLCGQFILRLEPRPATEPLHEDFTEAEGSDNGAAPLGRAIIRKPTSPFNGFTCFWTEPPQPGVSRQELRYTVQVEFPEGHTLAGRGPIYRNYFESDLEVLT